MGGASGSPLRQRLRDGEPLLGTFVKSNDASIAELLAAAQFDYLIVDLEHSSLAPSAVADIVRAAAVWCVPVLVRLSPERIDEAGRALEAGAAGVQVTGVSTPQTILMARRAVTLAPDGDLGLSLSHRAAGFQRAGAAQYLARLRDEIVVVAQIESRAAVEALPDLLAVGDPPDAWFLGPVDLSCDLGHPGEVGHPVVAAALDHAAELILAKGQRLAAFAGDIEDALRWRARGATAVALGSDLALLAERAAAEVRTWRAGAAAVGIAG
jgi:4-hydroxy-2-oxoheptanedioate aldolase